MVYKLSTDTGVLGGEIRMLKIFIGVLQAGLVILKLLGLLRISWWQVLMPLEIIFGILILVFLLLEVIKFIECKK